MRTTGLVVVALCCWSTVTAQTDKSAKSEKPDKAETKDAKPSQPERLFRTRDVLTLTLRAPLKTIFKNRDTTKAQSVAGSIELVDEQGANQSLPITLATRGHFRLRRSTCAFAPLKVTFDKTKTKGTVFSGQGGIKLVTHCQQGSSYEQNLLLEEAIYRAYNTLTDFSHRTRLARITYFDTEDTTKTVTRYGYFLEDDEELAKRNGGKLLMETGGHLSDMDPDLLDLIGVFEFMIGNTDWSVYAIHNIRLIDKPNGGGFYYPVAYDFDFSGLVNAPYAVPDERLPIKKVRQRLYRGACRKLDELKPTLERFTAMRDTIEGVFVGIKDLEPGRLKDVKEYLGDFFDQIKEPKRFDRELGYPCSIRR